MIAKFVSWCQTDCLALILLEEEVDLKEPTLCVHIFDFLQSALNLSTWSSVPRVLRRSQSTWTWAWTPTSRTAPSRLTCTLHQPNSSRSLWKNWKGSVCPCRNSLGVGYSSRQCGQHLFGGYVLHSSFPCKHYFCKAFSKHFSVVLLLLFKTCFRPQTCL